MIDVYRHQWVRKAIEDTITSVFGVSAGLGSGKTHGATDWHHDRVALNSKAMFSAFMMPIYAKIHDAAIPTFRKMYGDRGQVEGVDYRVVHSPYPKIVFPTGQEIHFISGNRPDRIVAVEYSHLTISEAGATDKDAIRNARSRVRDSRAVCRQTLLEGAPQGITHFAELMDSDSQEGWKEIGVRDYVKQTTDPYTNHVTQYRRFRLSTYDNQQFLPPEYIGQLYDIYGANQNYIRAYLWGFFCPLVEGNCYSNYRPGAHDIENRDPDPYLPVDLTMDFNADPLAWVSNQRIAFDEGDEARRFRVVAIHNSDLGATNLEDVAVEFAAKHPVARFADTPIRLFGDRSGYSASHKSQLNDFDTVAYYLRQLGYRCVEICALKYNPLETVTVDALNRWFLQDYHYICKRCENYRRSLIATRWKDGKKKIDKPADDKWTHHTDAQKYYAFAVEDGGSGRKKIRSKNL
jgi:hypothetical protein